MKKYDQDRAYDGVNECMVQRDDGRYYLASDVDARIAELEKTLRELLQDTQHVNHNCGDGPDLCPVLRAREVLNELMESVTK